MIQANELRRLNLVKTNKLSVNETPGTIKVVDGLNKSEVDLTDGTTQNLIGLEPIPLTEEILLKCGFEKLKYERYKLVVKGFSIEFELTGKYMFGCFLEMVGLDIQYLHELQNLYFVLTGKELEIKL